MMCSENSEKSETTQLSLQERRAGGDFGVIGENVEKVGTFWRAHPQMS